MCVACLDRLSKGIFTSIINLTPPPISREHAKHYTQKSVTLDPLAVTAYLAGIELPSGSVDELPARPTKTLSAIELCSGVGGQALGLMAAGFHLDALVDIDKNALEALRTNWPAWNVLGLDLQSPEALEILTRHKNVDLLAGGLSCLPVSRAGKGKGLADERELFTTALNIVRALKPKAVMFENVPGMTQRAHAKMRSQFLASLHQAGYHVDSFPISASDWGLPQDRTRTIIVGMSADLGPMRFRRPVPPRDLKTDFKRSMLDLVLPFRTPKDFEGLVREDQRVYDKWADTWEGTFGHERSPTVRDLDGRANKTWKPRGLDFTRITDEPVQVADNPRLDSLANVTVEMLARLQGMPHGWEIATFASNEERARLIGNIFPPVLARVIGHQIHEALTGEKVSLEKAVRDPIVDPHRIGRPPMLRRGKSPVLDFDPGDTAPENVAPDS